MTSSRVIAAIMALSFGTGCTFAIDHPAVSAGIAGAAIGFGSCKLESDDYAACGVVGAGAGAALAVVAAVALWLGGDGHTVLVEDQAQPVPDIALPPHKPAPPAAEPAPVRPPSAPDAAPLPAPPSSPSPPLSSP